MSAGGSLIGGIGSISKSIQGAKMEKRARRAIEAYERQELQNAYGDVSVSMLGADLQAKEMARATSTGITALQSGGTRALIGGIGQVQQNLNLQNQQIAADLDRQQKALDYARAQDYVRVQQMQERREEGDLAGLGRQMEVGRQDKYAGINELSQTMIAHEQRDHQNLQGFLGAMGGSGGMGGGMMGGGGGGMAAMFSDARLKKDIYLVGQSLSGINIYRFKYIEGLIEGEFEGVMAHELPEGIKFMDKSGFEKVDYSKIDVEYKRIS